MESARVPENVTSGEQSIQIILNVSDTFFDCDASVLYTSSLVQFPLDLFIFDGIH